MKRKVGTIISMALSVVILSGSIISNVSAQGVEDRSNCNHLFGVWQVSGQWYDRDPEGSVSDCSIRTTQWDRYCTICGSKEIKYTEYPMEHKWQYDYDRNIKFCVQKGCGVEMSINPISLDLL